MYSVTIIIGLITVILFQSRNDVMRMIRSDVVSGVKPAIIGLSGLGGTLFYKGYNAYQLYSSEWQFVFINQLNDTAGIASHRSLWNQDFSGQTDYHNVDAFSTVYVKLQPLMNVVWGYTYSIRIKWKDNSLLIPADLSSQTCKTFLITENGLSLASEQYYREWTYKHDGKFVVFQA